MRGVAGMGCLRSRFLCSERFGDVSLRWARSARPTRLTFEVSWRQRQDARPEPQKMYTVPVARAWWPAVGAQLDRGVRRQLHVATLLETSSSSRIFWVISVILQ
jgi:hypothetical protein